MQYPVSRSCARCGATYLTSRPTSRWCSNACRQAAKRARARAALRDTLASSPELLRAAAAELAEQAAAGSEPALRILTPYLRPSHPNSDMQESDANAIL